MTTPAAVRVKLREFIIEREEEIRLMQEEKEESKIKEPRAVRRGSNFLSRMFSSLDLEGLDDDDDKPDRMEIERVGFFTAPVKEADGEKSKKTKPDRRPSRGLAASLFSLPSLGGLTNASSDGSVSELTASTRRGFGSNTSLSTLASEIGNPSKMEQSKSKKLGGRRKSVEGSPPQLVNTADSLFEEFYSSQLKRVSITSRDGNALNFNKVDSSDEDETDEDSDDDRINNGSFEFPGRREFARKISDPDLVGPNKIDVSERTSMTLNESTLPSNRNKYLDAMMGRREQRRSDPNLTSGIGVLELMLPTNKGESKGLDVSCKGGKRSSAPTLTSGLDVSSLFRNDFKLHASQVEEGTPSADQECMTVLASLYAKTLSLQMEECGNDQQHAESQFYDILKKSAPRPVQRRSVHRRLSEKQSQQSPKQQQQSAKPPIKIELEVDWQDFEAPTQFQDKVKRTTEVTQDDYSGCCSEASDVAVVD